ncbi:peptide ABC transporter permease [Microvirga sp. 2YAF29]|uniref:peptide ABC transporter permease n=1 Tax=Microvirga sp. 2YAF29 TaxID=3233031 RepID=UPI003F9DADDA
MLRRIGFAILFLVIPSAAFFTRRALVVLAPLAVVLIVLASVLDGSARQPMEKLTNLLGSRATLAGGVLLLWACLSLIWTPFVPQASERLFNIIVMGVMALVGYLALPDRMRSANLYLLPVGVGLAALAAVPLLLKEGARLDPEGLGIERGMIVLVLLLWPAVTWLHSRGRNLEALALVLAVALGAFAATDGLPLFGMAVGALAFALTATLPTLGSRLVALVMAGLLLLAPVLPFVLKPLTDGLMGANSAPALSLGVWRDTILAEPLRLLTGHGLETSIRGRIFGIIPSRAPSTLLFEVWYELGLIGALAGAILLYRTAMGAGGQRPILGPGIMAAFATAFALVCFGIGTTQVWWFTALVMLVLIFVAIEHGQFRTTRPKAILRRRV